MEQKALESRSSYTSPSSTFHYVASGVAQPCGRGPTSEMISRWLDHTSLMASGVPMPAPLGSPHGPNLHAIKTVQRKSGILTRSQENTQALGNTGIEGVLRRLRIRMPAPLGSPNLHAAKTVQGSGWSSSALTRSPEKTYFRKQQYRFFTIGRWKQGPRVCGDWNSGRQRQNA